MAPSRIQSRFDEVTSHTLFRHTVGRASCILKVAVNTLGLVGQLAIMAVKLPIALIATPIAYGLKSRQFELLTFKGIAKDGLAAFQLLDRIGNSAIGVLCAPPKQAYSLWETTTRTFAIVCLGEMQSKWNSKNKALMSVHELARGLIHSRPQYSKLFSPCEALRDGLLHPKVASRIKAG